MTILKEKEVVNFKMSFILENWIDIYRDGLYIGTIPLRDFKTNFRYDNLNFSEGF
jgi:hypothetical protein